MTLHMLILEVVLHVMNGHALFDVSPEDQIGSPLLAEIPPVFFDSLLSREQELEVALSLLLLLKLC